MLVDYVLDENKFIEAYNSCSFDGRGCAFRNMRERSITSNAKLENIKYCIDNGITFNLDIEEVKLVQRLYDDYKYNRFETRELDNLEALHKNICKTLQSTNYYIKHIYFYKRFSDIYVDILLINTKVNRFKESGYYTSLSDYLDVFEERLEEHLGKNKNVQVKNINKQNSKEEESRVPAKDYYSLGDLILDIKRIFGINKNNDKEEI